MAMPSANNLALGLTKKQGLSIKTFKALDALKLQMRPIFDQSARPTDTYRSLLRPPAASAAVHISSFIGLIN